MGCAPFHSFGCHIASLSSSDLSLLSISLSLRRGTGQGTRQPHCSLSCNSTTTSTQQVNGNWFSTAQASDDLELLQEDSDMMFFIHKIHVILQTIEIKGMPPTLPPRSTDAGHNMIFLKDVGPHRFAIFCAHSNWHGKKRVVVNPLSWTPPVSCDVMQRFKNYCKSHRISPANTIRLWSGGDRCPHGHLATPRLPPPSPRQAP
uniref:Uncharacterized protein n=1 Tax=Canis lupus dingo TaxID=286419 RepID=A0A8C0JL92_CANLU